MRSDMIVVVIAADCLFVQLLLLLLRSSHRAPCYFFLFVFCFVGFHLNVSSVWCVWVHGSFSFV